MPRSSSSTERFICSWSRCRDRRTTGRLSRLPSRNPSKRRPKLCSSSRRNLTNLPKRLTRKMGISSGGSKAKRTPCSRKCTRKLRPKLAYSTKSRANFPASRRSKLKRRNMRRKWLNAKENNETLETQLKEIRYEYMLKLAQEDMLIQRENEMKLQEYMQKTREEELHGTVGAAPGNVNNLEMDIYENNSKLNEKCIFQRYEIDRIKKQKEQIMKLNKNYKRDMMLNAETMEEYSKRQQSQNKKIKLLKSKIQILEKSLSQIVQDFEKEKQLLKKQNEDMIRNQESELSMLKDDSRQKSKELKMLKSLANVIIEQRSDIEQFFLEALEQIKEEIRKKMTEEKKLKRFRLPGDSIGGTAGSIGHTTGGSQDQTKSYADKVDLNDLDWEDRERVLRLLFSKINAGVHPSSNWKSIENEGEGDIQAIENDE